MLEAHGSELAVGLLLSAAASMAAPVSKAAMVAVTAATGSRNWQQAS